jgi:hypothetical protein
MYKLIKSSVTNEINAVLRIEDYALIPMNPDNTDYQAYLRWLEEGNTPLPAEENQ